MHCIDPLLEPKPVYHNNSLLLWYNRLRLRITILQVRCHRGWCLIWLPPFPTRCVGEYLSLRLVMTYSQPEAKKHCGPPCSHTPKPCCQSAPSYPDFCGLCHAKTPIVYWIPACDIPNHCSKPYKPTRPAPTYPEPEIVATFDPVSYVPISVQHAVPHVSSTSSDSTGYWDIPSYAGGCDC